MGESPFTEAQNAYIDSFMDALTAKLDAGTDSHELTKWKQTTASEIQNSPLFTTLDLADHNKQQWFQIIVRKFTNYRNNIYLKKKSPPRQTQSPTKGASLVNFSSVLTGRQLFAREQADIINKAITERLATSEHTSTAAIYQSVLKEMWESLSLEDQETWKTKASNEAGDVAKNQTEFVPEMHAALSALCRNGMLGDAELLMFYGFRSPTNGDLLTGTIHGHSSHNRINFGGDRSELQAKYGVPWITFAENVLPRPSIRTPISIIPRSPTGIPIFPCVDLNAATPSGTRQLLTEYFTESWDTKFPVAHMWGADSEYPSIPWQKILTDPTMFYDVTQFSFPVKIQDPEKMSNVETVILSEYLMHNSSVLTVNPFRFWSQAEIQASVDTRQVITEILCSLLRNETSLETMRHTTTQAPRICCRALTKPIPGASATKHAFPEDDSNPQSVRDESGKMPEILQTSNDDKNEPNSSQKNDENNDMVDDGSGKGDEKALEPAKKRARLDVTAKTARVRTSARCLQPKTVNKVDNKKQTTGRRYRMFVIPLIRDPRRFLNSRRGRGGRCQDRKEFILNMSFLAQSDVSGAYVLGVLSGRWFESWFNRLLIPPGYAITLFTTSTYAVRSICYWAGGNYTRGWACTNGDLLELAALLIRGRSASIKFVRLTPGDTTNPAYVAARALAASPISAPHGPVYVLPVAKDIVTELHCVGDLPKVSTTLPAEDPPKAKVMINVTTDELAIGDQPDSHRSRRKYAIPIFPMFFYSRLEQGSRTATSQPEQAPECRQHTGVLGYYTRVHGP
ncbi:hypothetical protein C8J57DRAFT_1572036 [Mycena rebaudengoi]|nr:hypothetical protein C8J57DRAFT_1572036 [Mycena rebaudengoi]